MSVDTQTISPLQTTYYVMNMYEDKWVKISESFVNLEEAKQAYLILLKDYPFARLGGSSLKEN